MEIVIIQRICPNYKLDLFRKIQEKNRNTVLIIGDSIPNSKLTNSSRINEINFIKLRSFTFKFFGRHVVVKPGLLATLIKLRPKIIICESESHPLGYLTALFYKMIIKKKTRLIKWGIFLMPGKKEKKFLLDLYKYLVYKNFDHFFLYHTFGKKKLLDLNVPSIKQTVVLNVGRVEYFKKLKEKKIGKNNARNYLDIPNRITLIYMGALEKVKGVDLLVELAKADLYNIIVLGNGPEFKNLKSVPGILAPGHVSNPNELINYLCAADIGIVPGRGGVVISELLSFGIPMIVHQADGVEYDLIDSIYKGKIIDFANVENVIDAVNQIKQNQNIIDDKKQTTQDTMAQIISNTINDMLSTI